MSGEYSVDELLQQRANILQEIADNKEDVSNSSARWGCDCGCGGDFAMDYEMELYEQLQEVEAELALHGINNTLTSTVDMLEVIKEQGG